jgi:hypothetical protein
MTDLRLGMSKHHGCMARNLPQANSQPDWKPSGQCAIKISVSVALLLLFLAMLTHLLHSKVHD